MNGTRALLAALLVALVSACAPPMPANTPDPGLWFPRDYVTSRARFRADCKRLKTGPEDYCGVWAVTSHIDPDLTIDHAFFSKGGDRLLVIQSGIHGSEAHSGAAVEAYAMAKYVPTLLAKGIDVVFIHTLNPYGFKYGRRTDEFNVNLNRNFGTGEAVFHTPNLDYRRFRNVFEPKGKVGNVMVASLREKFGFLKGFTRSRMKAKPLMDGLDNGQYDFPRGINYGGKQAQEQTRFLREVVGPIMKRPYRRVLFLDFHTGLGPKGELAIILGKQPAREPLARLRRMFDDQEKNGIAIKTGDSPGYFATSGDVIDFAPTLARDPNDALAVTMEYGTLGTDPISQLNSASRMILENQAHFNGCETPAICRRVRAEFRALFYPSDPDWRGTVLREADLLFRILLDRF